MKYLQIIILMLLICLFTGCSSVTVLENDMTLSQLEDRMEQAMDPKGVLSAADSFYQCQTLKYEGIFSDDLYEIQIRYLKPHYLKVTTLKFNQLQSAFIFNGNAAWSVDYRKKTIKNLVGDELLRIKALYYMMSPGSRYEKLFKQVNLDKIMMDEKVFYRLTCYTEDAGNKLVIYVDAEDFLREKLEYDFRVEIDGKVRRIESTGLIEAYDTVNNVLYPLEMKNITNGVESETVVSEYRLNVGLEASEFQAPLFPNESETRKKHKEQLEEQKKKAEQF